MMEPRWRLLRQDPGDGRLNMATDAALLKACEEGEFSTPTLRVYGWSRPTLTVGHSQNLERDVDSGLAQALGVDVVRRPTGGRALLHSKEVTYSIVAPFGACGLRVHLKDIFEDISRYLMAGLVRLGIPAGAMAWQDVRQRRAPGGRSAACFAELHFGEITVKGKKLVGSAQRRIKNSFLQHGSILLDEDMDLFTQICRYGSEDLRQAELRRLREGTTTLRQELGAGISFERSADALVSGFGESDAFSLQPGGLTPRECELRDAILRGS